MANEAKKLTRTLRRCLQVGLLCSAVFAFLGAGDESARFNSLGHRLMCVCSCNQILLECNHVGCTYSDRMRGELMAGLARSGAVFDAIFQHVVDPPPTPIADHVSAFVEWTAEQLLTAVNLYTAYPSVTVKQVKALVAAADVSGASELHPFLVILPIKSYLHFLAVQLILRARGSGTTKDLDKVGTPHFAQFVPLEDNQIGFFTVYDGSFDKYIADFTKNIGEVFDLIFKFTKNPPPSPCRKYLQEFVDFAAGANRTPIGFYQNYPGLSVQDIHALIADSKSSTAAAG